MCRVMALLAVVGATALCSCDRSRKGEDPNMAVQTGTIAVRSSDFAANQPIPRKFTGEGQDISPALAWSDLPPEAKQLALIVDDPDAPTAEPFVHWVIYNLPASLNGLGGNVEKSPQPADPKGARQGINSFGNVGYGGPMPPPGHGVHHYRFHLYALDAALDLKPALTKKDVLAAIRGHILADGELVGTYERK